MTSPVTFEFGIISPWDRGERLRLVALTGLKGWRKWIPRFITRLRSHRGAKWLEIPAPNKLPRSFGTAIHTSCTCEMKENEKKIKKVYAKDGTGLNRGRLPVHVVRFGYFRVLRMQFEANFPHGGQPRTRISIRARRPSSGIKSLVSCE